MRANPSISLVGVDSLRTNLMTVEEHNVMGGLGAAVSEVLTDEGLPIRLVRHGIHDTYSLIAPPLHLYRHYLLDGEGVAHVARWALQGRPVPKTGHLTPSRA